MSDFLSSVVHAAGNVAAPALEAAGGALSFGGLMPNLSANTFTNAGHAISNPNVVASNLGGTFTLGKDTPGSRTFTNVPQSGQQPGQATPNGNQNASNDFNNAVSNGFRSGFRGGGGGGAAAPPTGALLGQAYDQQLQGLRGQYDSIPVYRDVAANDIYKGYNDQNKQLTDQYGTGQQNQQLAQQHLEMSRSNGVRDLGDQLRQSLNGYQMQLGTMGAGNSSAAGLLAYGLQQQGNKGMNDLNQQYNNQQEGLNVAGKNLNDGYQNSVKNLVDWRDSQLHSIASTYASQQGVIQSQMDGSLISKAYAMQQNQALAQQTLDQMRSLDAQHGTTLQQLNDHFASVKSDNHDIGQYVNGFNQNPALTTQGIAPANLSGMQGGVDTSQYNTPVSLQKRSVTQPF